MSTAPCGWEGEEREKEKVRKEEVRAAGRQNVLNNYDHHPLGRTCEAVAPLEVHCLHAFGEHDLVDSTLRVGRQREGKV